MLIRETLEQLERQTLSKFAVLSAETKGRRRHQKACSVRPAFQHDRDKIVHSKSFRRLMYKTQVFLAPAGDHYRTRMTHTIEVSQIARTIAKALLLNESLTEAIAMGHDLGHTPFGHGGEAVLNDLMPEGFHHVNQSLRVVEVLERNGRGLNLTFEVRDGIFKHSKGKGKILVKGGESPATLEGQIVRLADIIAYVNHDIDDAVRARVLSLNEIPPGVVRAFGRENSVRINRMVVDVIRNSDLDVEPRIRMSAEGYKALMALRDFLYARVYENMEVKSEFRKTSEILLALWRHFKSDEQRFREKFWPRARPGDSLDRSICDFIAGMTDRYAISLYQELFLPKPWTVY